MKTHIFLILSIIYSIPSFSQLGEIVKIKSDDERISLKDGRHLFKNVETGLFFTGHQVSSPNETYVLELKKVKKQAPMLSVYSVRSGHDVKLKNQFILDADKKFAYGILHAHLNEGFFRIVYGKSSVTIRGGGYPNIVNSKELWQADIELDGSALIHKQVIWDYIIPDKNYSENFNISSSPSSSLTIGAQIMLGGVFQNKSNKLIVFMDRNHNRKTKIWDGQRLIEQEVFGDLIGLDVDGLTYSYTTKYLIRQNVNTGKVDSFKHNVPFSFTQVKVFADSSSKIFFTGNSEIQFRNSGNYSSFLMEVHRFILDGDFNLVDHQKIDFKKSTPEPKQRIDSYFRGVANDNINQNKSWPIGEALIDRKSAVKYGLLNYRLSTLHKGKYNHYLLLEQINVKPVASIVSCEFGPKLLVDVSAPVLKHVFIPRLISTEVTKNMNTLYSGSTEIHYYKSSVVFTEHGISITDPYLLSSIDNSLSTVNSEKTTALAKTSIKNKRTRVSETLKTGSNRLLFRIKEFSPRGELLDIHYWLFQPS